MTTKSPKKVLKVHFDLKINTQQIRQFRGAISSKVDEQARLFHNHLPDQGFRYGYPLIQYKRVRGKASVVCVGEGIEQLQYLLLRRDWFIRFGNREVGLHAEQIRAETITEAISCRPIYTYRVLNWLNKEFDYKQYNKLMKENSLIERLQLIEQKLANNLVEYAKGVGISLDSPFKCEILAMEREAKPLWEKIQMAAFDFTFRSNVKLPLFIGLGKACGRGYGTVHPVVRDKSN